MIQEAIRKLADGQALSRADAAAAMRCLMDGEATPAQIAAFLVALRMKGETVEEIAGCAEAMRERAARVETRHETVVDTCGTGGDASGSFNISTAAAFVAAAGGCCVAKHGNRSVSSRCGSADVLEALGVRIDLSAAEVGRCLDEAAIGFLFAPFLHPAMKNALAPRREMGIRTVMNCLGPLTNPAGAKRQVVGVYALELVEKTAHVLAALGTEHALVVHGEDGLDEISLAGPTRYAEVRDGVVRIGVLEPAAFGFETAPPEAVRGGSPEENAALLGRLFRGEERGPARDIVALNAGAALYVAGVSASIRDGSARALAVLGGGGANERLDALRRAAAGS